MIAHSTVRWPGGSAEAQYSVRRAGASVAAPRAQSQQRHRRPPVDSGTLCVICKAHPHAARASGGDGEGAGAASRRRLQQQLGDDRPRRGAAEEGEPAGGGAAPGPDMASDAAAAAAAPGEWWEQMDAGASGPDAPAAAVAAADSPAPPPAAADAPPQLSPQGWSDDAPPALTASVAITPRGAAGIARLMGGGKRQDPITLFFAKCKLAWSVFFPSPEEQKPPANPRDNARQRLSMILVADRAGLSPGSLMQMKQNTVKALAETMDMRELADAQLRFTMVRQQGVTYSMAVPIIDEGALGAGEPDLDEGEDFEDFEDHEGGGRLGGAEAEARAPSPAAAAGVDVGEAPAPAAAGAADEPGLDYEARACLSTADARLSSLLGAVEGGRAAAAAEAAAAGVELPEPGRPDDALAAAPAADAPAGAEEAAAAGAAATEGAAAAGGGGA
ncbi:MAG: hypothetical protein J3K34DRAFT_494310 [Monoraphidium minutum]|nr:MAG: hypothetical protein J3K34DRAFT_494310 [Monoraphidium minutum]